MNILVRMAFLFKNIYNFLDGIKEKLPWIFLIVFYFPCVFPFFVLWKFFEYTIKFCEMNKNYEKHSKAFMKWYKEHKDELN